MKSPWEAEVGAVRVLYGEGRFLEAAQVVLDLGCSRPLVVSDPGLLAAGHLHDLEAAFVRADLEAFTFTDISTNPTTEQVDAGVRFAAPQRPDCVVALGGGSAMDCAKGINLLLTNGGRMQEYWGFGLARQALLPALGIPTTAGTGSEAQSYALITDADNQRKMACGDSRARFRTVILDPTLLGSAPAEVAASSGLDAVSHALESYVSTRRNPISDLMALRAWQLLDANLLPSLEPDADLVTRGRVLWAAHLAGAAIEQSMLGAAHACANPLTTHHGVAHGQAVAAMLPHVIRFNGPTVEEDYRELTDAAGLAISTSAAETLARRVEELMKGVRLSPSIAQWRITESAIPSLASAAAAEWTGKFNPRPVAQQEFESLYESALRI